MPVPSLSVRSVLRLSLLAFTCASVAACGDDVAPDNGAAAPPTTATDTIIPEAPTVSAEDSAYVSSILPVEMRIPAAWANRWRAREVPPTDPEGGFPGSLHAVRFDYRPGDEGQLQQPLFALIAYTRDAWKPDSTSGIRAEEVASRGDTVYVAVVATANPYQPGSREAQRWSALRLSAEDVRTRLQLR